MKSKTNAVMASMLFMIITVPSYASESFPLDIWKEMADWQQRSAKVKETDLMAYRQPVSMTWNHSKMIHTSFPFDVMETLADLDSNDGHRHNGRFANIDNSHGGPTTPYWLPAEYGANQVDPSSVK